MKKPLSWASRGLCWLVLWSSVVLPVVPRAAEPAAAVAPASLPATPQQATGTFDVKMVPHATGADAAKPGAPGSIGQFTLEKQFRGGLEGTAHGEMIAAGTTVKGSAGYVAIERVEGTLAGRRGTFLLQHHGIMTRGAGRLSIEVVPDSGTADLMGLAGTMTIDIEADGTHRYAFSFTLPPTQ